MGYCPFSSYGSRYNVLYRDKHGLGVHGQVRYGRAGVQQGVATQPGGAATRPACARGERQRAGVRPGHWVVS